MRQRECLRESGVRERKAGTGNMNGIFYTGDSLYLKFPRLFENVLLHKIGIMSEKTCMDQIAQVFEPWESLPRKNMEFLFVYIQTYIQTYIRFNEWDIYLVATIKLTKVIYLRPTAVLSIFTGL